jgi:hypothetical protein
MGWISVAMGPALILGIGTVLMPVWLIALGAMLLGLWPRGIPPAWEEGRAVPWPSMSPPRATEELVGGSRNGEVEPVGPGVRQAEEPPGPAPGRTRKRKR